MDDVPSPTKPAELSVDEIHAAMDLLRRYTPEHDLLRMAPTGSAAIYTTLITLWMLTLQRLGGGLSLARTVKEVLVYLEQLLPNNKRLHEGTLSENSAAYSQARQRLPLAAVEFFADRVCQSLIEQTPSWWEDQRAFLIDGTTLTLSPTSELRHAFPPATNQHGQTVWPVLMLFVAHELQSGCALLPEIGAMYGKDNTSEAAQAAALVKRLPPRSLVLADAGLGIFQVAWALHQADHDFLLRLTKQRWKALHRQGEKVAATDTATTHRLRWRPSVKDRAALPQLPPEAELNVPLHAVQLPTGEELFLVTNLSWSSEQAQAAYARRYDVEHDLRDLKVTLGLEKIRARSQEMVLKELYCSVVAYNLVQEFRRQAAAVAGVPPRRLSFTQVWNTFDCLLLRQPPAEASEWKQRYERALRMAAKDKLPNRPGRSYPRKAHPRRAKSTKFMRKKPPPDTK